MSASGTVWLIVFNAFGQQWISIYQALDTQTILVSRINSVIWDSLTITSGNIISFILYIVIVL